MTKVCEREMPSSGVQRVGGDVSTASRTAGVRRLDWRAARSRGGLGRPPPPSAPPATPPSARQREYCSRAQRRQECYARRFAYSAGPDRGFSSPLLFSPALSAVVDVVDDERTTTGAPHTPFTCGSGRWRAAARASPIVRARLPSRPSPRGGQAGMSSISEERSVCHHSTPAAYGLLYARVPTPPRALARPPVSYTLCEPARHAATYP